MCLEILEARSYAAIKEMAERPGVKEKDLPDHPLLDLYWELKAETVQERLAQRRKAKGS